MTNTKQFNLENFVGSTCEDNSRGGNGSTGFNIVHSKNGNRISLSHDKILQYLDHDDTLQFAYSDRHIAIAAFFNDEQTSHKLSGKGSGKMIYNMGLIKEIVEHFGLDYSNKTSQSFPIEAIQEDEEGNNVVYIEMLDEADLEPMDEALDSMEEELEEDNVESEKDDDEIDEA